MAQPQYAREYTFLESTFRRERR